MTVPAVFAGAGSTAVYVYDPATGGGRLTGVTDPAGNAFTFTYKPSGELTQIAEPGNERRNLSWDSDGRLLTDQVVRPVGCGTDWPCFDGNGPFRNTSFTGYDPQGRLLNSSDAATFAETTTASYTPLGHLASTTQTQRWIGPYVAYNLVTYTAAETLTHDGLGNLVGRQEGWTVATGGSSTTTSTASSAAFDGSGRQTGLSPGGGAGTWSKAYDAAGNLEWEQRVTNPNPAEERASFYAADQTLAVVDRRTGTTRWYEHYRYDPLGRRVLVISQVQCAPINSLECYASRIRRTIWDGAQELGEIQVPYDSTAYWENDTGPYPRPYFLQHGSSATGDPNPLFGQVLYGPGVAVDQPLSVIRFKYTDRPNDGAAATTWPTFTLLPQWNHRGVATFGVFSTGFGYKNFENSDSLANCPILGTTTPKRCVIVQWPAGQSAYDQQRGGQEKLSWFGSVIEGKRDGVGLEYKRNRYYDPQAGRFTQGDPIGVAGGLNAYGFAGGDPVNFSDPFGLATDTIRAELNDPNAALLENAYLVGRQSVAAEASRDDQNAKAVDKILGNYEKSRTVIQLRTGKVSGSEFGSYENKIITVDVESIQRNGTGKTTVPFVVIHEIGHGYAALSLGYVVGASEQLARMLFENSARRGLKQTERTMTEYSYPPLKPVP